MQINNNLGSASWQADINKIKEFGMLINAEKITLQNKSKYDDLLEVIKDIAEYKNSNDAQYYLAKHFLQLGDINNYKFWLMRAAKNIDPHPLANIKLVKFCLEKYYEFLVHQPNKAEAYLVRARNHLHFIMELGIYELQKRFDWLYAKEQAKIIWQKEFATVDETAAIWPAPNNGAQLNKPNTYYLAELSQRAKTLSERIKKLFYKIKQQ